MSDEEFDAIAREIHDGHRWECLCDDRTPFEEAECPICGVLTCTVCDGALYVISS